ncbi:chitosanase [Chytriomyces confervae]|uniref:Chitosanase n=1 Tax=Chytriomyces confervae TaxID=246404 RepID=A0A507FVV5_9FUNG|nr:chitosanase [Chytriomyces confervae]
MTETWKTSDAQFAPVEADTVKQESAGPCPKDAASFTSRMTFSWVDSLFRKGFKQPLVVSDLWEIPSNLGCTDLADSFMAIWKQEVQTFLKARAEQGLPEYVVDGAIVRSVIWKLYFRQIFSLGFLRMLSDLCNLLSPYFVQYIILFVQNRENEPVGKGIGFAIGLFALQLLSTFSINQFSQEVAVCALSLKTAVTAVIYRKSLTLTSSARQEFDAGTVINMVSTDTARIEQFINQVNFLWTLPIMVIINLGFLIAALGVSALVGVGILVIALPIQTQLFKQMKLIRREQAPITDKRVKKTTEVLNGVRVIKLFAWEESFVGMLGEIRADELRQVLKRAVYQSIVMTQAMVLPVLTSCCSFVVYSLMNPLNPAYIFSSLSWFNQLRQPIWMLPNILNTWAEFNIAVIRIESLLLAKELESRSDSAPSDLKHSIIVKEGNFEWSGPVFIEGVLPSEQLKSDKKKDKKKEKKKEKETKSAQLQIQDANLSSNEKEEAAPETSNASSGLSDININIPRGALVAIVGSVGAGKSSLLNALIGEMRKISGTVEFAGSVSYACQTAWIQNASVRENITFGTPYEEDRYVRAIHDAALLPDLKILNDGDQTSIGERGINLSGGQKQRINLARLMYSKSDIVLMDDPLSAVDAHVGRHLFDNCIQGSLKSRTRLLVTHQLHYLPECDYILFVQDGRITEQGLYTDLMKNGDAFATMINAHASDNHSTPDVSEKPENSAIYDEIRALVNSPKSAKNIMRIEDQETGGVNSAVWWRYMKAAGGSSFIIKLSILVLFVQGGRVGNDLWLTAWTSHTFDLSNMTYIGIYLGLGLGLALSLFFYALFFAYTGARASKVLHEMALLRVLRCPVYFFDTTPLGRIINRFSRDFDAVDNSIALNFRQLVQQLSICVSTFAVMCYALPLFTIPVVPAIGVYYFVQNLYRKSARELKRLDSTTKSPLYANFGETVIGISTIRAYADESRFIARNDHVTDVTNAPYFLLVTSQNWLSVRLQLIGSILVLCAALFGVLSHGITAALFGLCLSYSLTVTQTLAMAVQNFTQTEIAMNSVERVEHYAYRLESEAEPINPDYRPPTKAWPVKGEIEFKNVTMRYAPSLPVVLDNVSFKIGDGEKVGIVGRTGSGKSTLMQALFRMVEAESGTIVIDQVESNRLGLKDLRTSLAIIPQDPVVFSGTFRFNLDPFNEHSDSELWDAVTRAGLGGKVSKSENKLDARIEAGGENLSVGERQLLCLARAMLKRPKILIMDEATANVDYETDSQIQKVLREDMREASILTIAHRLNTIMDYDRVMVLDQGKLCEFDSPRALMNQPDSMFRALVMQTVLILRVNALIAPRCGTTYADAASHCHASCKNNGDCSPSAPNCFAGLETECRSTKQSNTTTTNTLEDTPIPIASNSTLVQDEVITKLPPYTNGVITSRCGLNFSDANSSCQRFCTSDADCLPLDASSQCRGGLTVACKTETLPKQPGEQPKFSPLRSRCGKSFQDADTSCSRDFQYCKYDSDCPPKLACFAGLKTLCYGREGDTCDATNSNIPPRSYKALHPPCNASANLVCNSNKCQVAITSDLNGPCGGISQNPPVPYDSVWGDKYSTDLSGGLMTNCQYSLALRITSLFETKARNLGFGACSVTDDGQGISAGFIQFTTCAGTILDVCNNFLSRQPENNFCSKYMSALVSEKGADHCKLNTGQYSLPELDDFCMDWTATQHNELFEKAQLQHQQDTYFAYTRTVAAEFGLRMPLTITGIQDTFVQGGVDQILSLMSSSVDSPLSGGDEYAWFGEFLDARDAYLDAMGGAYAVSKRRVNLIRDVWQRRDMYFKNDQVTVENITLSCNDQFF